MPSQIKLPLLQSRGDDTLSPRRTDVLCRSCTCSRDSRPLENAVKGDVILHPTPSLDTFSMLVDPPDQSIEDTDGIGAFEPFFVPIGPEMDLLSFINISGRPEFQQRIRALCKEFEGLFSNTVGKNPADIKPFKLKVDLEKWDVRANRDTPRKLPPEKQAEVWKQVQELLDAGVIEKSEASYYSQILLIPKPGTNVWRMCVDYRNINSCTEPASWPIPNIDQIFVVLVLIKEGFLVTQTWLWVITRSR